VTSDDPAVFTNKYAIQRLKDNSLGVMSSGLILTMPLTPRLAIMCYDGQVYTIPSLVNGRLVLKKPADVEALNELQFLKAATSIYFRPWADAESVRDKFESVRERRIEEWAVVKHHAFVRIEGDREIYREA